MRCSCAPTRQDSALYPVIAQFQRAAGLKRDDTTRQKLDKLETTLAQATVDLAKPRRSIAELLSIPTDGRYPSLDLSPQKRREKTLQALLAQVEGLARQPMLLVFEDAHWIDPTSLELLNLVGIGRLNLSLMLVVTFRPEFVAPWIGRPHVMHMNLDRLPRERIAEMIANLTRNQALPGAIVDQIIRRTDGVPLFVEELTKVLMERGTTAPHEIPATLRDMLTARLDRLDGAKEIAQIASVIGNEFSLKLLRERDLD